MKTLFSLLLVAFFTISISAQTFDCDGYNSEVVVSDISCSDDVIQFVVTSSNILSCVNIGPLPAGWNFTGDGFASSPTVYSYNNGTATGVATITVPSSGCSEVLNTSIDFNPGCNNGPFNLLIDPSSLIAIPTLGQWGIILLGLLIAIGGIISVRRKMPAST